MAQSLTLVSNILENYEFQIPNLSDRLKCVICHLILKNAKQTKCGCKVCEKCIKEYLSTGPKKCPGNQQDCINLSSIVDDVYQDNATNKEIGNMRVKCPFTACKYTNSLRLMNLHIELCEYREIVCEKCKKKYVVIEQQNHERNHCDMRMVTCTYCEDTMKYRDLNSIHLDPDNPELCRKYFALCPNNCAVKTKINLRDHLRDCVNQKIECPFHSYNCNIGKMRKEQLVKHFQSEFVDHMGALIGQVRTMQETIDTMHQEQASQKQVWLELLEINRASSKTHLKMEHDMEELKKRAPPPPPASILNSSFSNSSTSIGTLQSQLPDFRQPIIFRNANFIWRFTDFEFHRLNAANNGRLSVTSDPFYTSDFGYKMCLRLYPAGDGVGKGTHLSVFFAIMRGDYDDLLTWPFKQKVTLNILDQDSGTKNHCDTFKPDSRSACYQKPTEDCNIASGSPKFIALSLVTAMDSIYCRNDTIYLKITVDTLGISKP